MLRFISKFLKGLAKVLVELFKYLRKIAIELEEANRGKQ